MREAIAATTAALLALSSPAFAQLNGLQRFEREIKPQLEEDGGTFTYDGAAALGPSGFVLNGVRVTVPADKNASPADSKPSRVGIDRLTVEDFDFDGAARKEPPRFARMRVDGVKSIGEESGLDKLMRSYGIPDVALNVVIDFRQDDQRKVFALNRLEVALPGQARLELSLTLDGVASLAPPPAADAAAKDAAKPEDEIKLRTATILYEDASLLGRVLTAAAHEQGVSPDDWTREAAEFLALLSADQPPEVLAMLDALVSYVQD